MKDECSCRKEVLKEYVCWTPFFSGVEGRRFVGPWAETWKQAIGAFAAGPWLPPKKKRILHFLVVNPPLLTLSPLFLLAIHDG